MPTLNVFVRTTGVSMVPSSFTWVEPASFPNAFPTNTAPATLSWNTLPPCGTMAVTPVRTRSPSMTVARPSPWLTDDDNHADRPDRTDQEHVAKCSVDLQVRPAHRPEGLHDL